MKFGTFLHVAREGWWLILGALLAGVLAVWLGGGTIWLGLGAIVAVLCLGYFREPDRRIPPLPLGVLAPLDGRIVHRRECHDPYLDRAAIRVGIELDRFGAYYVRAPIEGTLMEVRRSGQLPRADLASWIQTDEKDDVVVATAQGSMLGARPCQNPYGQRVGQGRRCGMRRLARRIDLYLPAHSRIEVSVGDHVVGGSDLIATLVHNSSQA